jgi:hypothetical protein
LKIHRLLAYLALSLISQIVRSQVNVQKASFFFLFLELKNKVDELAELYAAIKAETDSRNTALEQTLGVSEKFWDNFNGIVNTLKELQDNLASQEPAALEPELIREQQEVVDVSIFDMGS